MTHGTVDYYRKKLTSYQVSLGIATFFSSGWTFVSYRSFFPLIFGVLIYIVMEVVINYLRKMLFSYANYISILLLQVLVIFVLRLDIILKSIEMSIKFNIVGIVLFVR